MKTYKQFISERAAEAYALVSLLKSGEIATQEQLNRYLIDNYKMQTLGSGNFSYAESTIGGKDFVLKVSRSPALYYDDAWWDFAKVAQDNYKRNKLFPNILHIAELPRFDGDSHTIGVAIVERLYVYSNNARADLCPTKINDLFISARLLDDRPKMFKEKFDKLVNTVCPKLDIKPEDVIDFVEIVKGVSDSLDIHSDNYGFRPDGSFVVFDPLSWKDE